jgi:predicted  nucleic acid-binding Zn-ribbon protein
MHVHQCRKCHAVWVHGDENVGVEDAHTCYKCGQRQVWKFYGNTQITPAEAEEISGEQWDALMGGKKVLMDDLITLYKVRDLYFLKVSVM